MTDFEEVGRRMKIQELERKIWALEEHQRETEKRLRALESETGIDG